MTKTIIEEICDSRDENGHMFVHNRKKGEEISADMYDIELCVNSWDVYGREIIVVENKLVEAFLDTEPVPAWLLADQLPFKSFFISYTTYTYVQIGMLVTQGTDIGTVIHLMNTSRDNLRAYEIKSAPISALKDRAVDWALSEDNRSVYRMFLNTLISLSRRQTVVSEPTTIKRRRKLKKGRRTKKTSRISKFRTLKIDPHARAVTRVVTASNHQTGTGRTQARHVCFGHNRFYWVKTLKDGEAHDQVRINKAGNTLYRVTRRIQAHWKGSGKPTQRTYKAVRFDP